MSSVLMLAVATAACGDSSKAPVMQETASESSAPGASGTPAAPNAEAPVPPKDANSPAPATTPSSPDEEGQGNQPIPIAPTAMAGAPGGPAAPQSTPPITTPPSTTPPSSTPPAGNDDNLGQQMPAAMMPPPEPAQPPEFNPCPTDGSACEIMPLGDSITFGMGSAGAGSNGGYRVELFRQAVSDGHNITFVGTQPPNGPSTVAGKPFPRNHEGLSGDTIQGTGNRARNAIPSTTPNIILLHIGTNNFGGQTVPQGVPGQLAALVDQITQQAPDALLVVAQLIPTEDAARTQGTQAYNATIPALVQDRAAKGKHVVVVDMFTPFANNPGGPNALFFDVLHPNVAGYAVMAQTWYGAIENVLP